MEKIIKTAKELDKVLSFLRGLLIAVSVICAVVFGIMIIIAEDFTASLNKSDAASGLSVTSGILKLRIDNPSFETANVRMSFVATLIFAAVVLGISLIAVNLLKSIIGDMKNGNPFSRDIPVKIRQLAYTVFAYAVAIPLCQNLFSYYMFKMFNARQILSESNLIGSVDFNYNYSVSVMAVLLGFIVILLSKVFEYGALLQRESDETL